MWSKADFPVDLVAFTEAIRNEKFDFCKVVSEDNDFRDLQAIVSKSMESFIFHKVY